MYNIKEYHLIMKCNVQSFKASVCPEISFTQSELRDLLHSKTESGTQFSDASNTLTVEFIGWSRIDGDPMFKILKSSKDLTSYFSGRDNTLRVYSNDSACSIQMKLKSPRIISMIDDKIISTIDNNNNNRCPQKPKNICNTSESSFNISIKKPEIKFNFS